METTTLLHYTLLWYVMAVGFVVDLEVQVSGFWEMVMMHGLPAK